MRQGGSNTYEGKGNAELVAIGEFAQGFACQWPEEILSDGCYAPSVGIPGYASSGSGLSLRDMTDVYQVRSNYSKIVGNHTFKAGGNWNTNGYFGPGFGGGVSFSALQTSDPSNPGNTGSGLASFLLSVPAVGRRRGNIEQVVGHRVYGFYVQDTWKVTPRLTINLGVRNDATIFGHYGSDEYNNNKVGNLNLILGRYELQIPVGSCAALGGAPCIPGGTLPDGVVLSPNQKPSNDRPWNWQGRFGLAYRITDKMAFRGAYGIVYDNWAGNIQANMGVVGTWPSVGLLQQPNLNLPSSALPTPKVTAQDPLDLGDNPVFPAPTPFNEVTWYYDPALKLPYSQQYNLSFQYQLSESTLVDLAYVVRRAKALAPSGCKSRPANCRSSRKQSERLMEATTWTEALCCKRVAIGRLSEHAGRNQMNAEQASKKSMRRPTRRCNGEGCQRPGSERRAHRSAPPGYWRQHACKRGTEATREAPSVVRTRQTGIPQGTGRAGQGGGEVRTTGEAG